MARRVRLLFSSDISGLPLPRSSLILLPDLKAIVDISEFLRQRFFSDAQGLAFRIELSGFTIHQQESADVVRDDDTLSIVIFAAQQPDHANNSEFGDDSLKRIEKHRVRREKQRETKKRSKKGTMKKTKADVKLCSGGVVVTTVSSNDAAAVSEPMHAADFTLTAQEQSPVQKLPASHTPIQTQAFSRVNLSASGVKPLPKGHFRFDHQNGVVAAEAVAALSHSPKSVERAKKLGSYFFKSSPLSIATNSRPTREQDIATSSGINEVILFSTTDTSAGQSNPESPKFDVTMMPDSSKGVHDVSNYSEHCSGLVDSRLENSEAGFEKYSVDQEDHSALLETIAIRGQNFFAPRTLGRFGLKHEQSEDNALQEHCKSLASVADLRMLSTCAEIAFQRLEIVNWAPQMSKFQKYRVLEMHDASKEVTLVNSDDQEETISLQEMHEVKLLESHHLTPPARIESTVDSDLAAALQAKRISILAKARGQQ